MDAQISIGLHAKVIGMIGKVSVDPHKKHRPKWGDLLLADAGVIGVTYPLPGASGRDKRLPSFPPADIR